MLQQPFVLQEVSAGTHVALGDDAQPHAGRLQAGEEAAQLTHPLGSCQARIYGKHQLLDALLGRDQLPRPAT